MLGRRSILLCLGLSLACEAAAEPAAVANVDAARRQMQARIEKIQLERKKVAMIRAELEKKMGLVGRELRKLDDKLIEARAARRKLVEEVEQVDHKLAALARRKHRLQRRVHALKARLLDEALAAWERGPHSSLWLGVLTGVPISEIPHRRYLLHVLMRSQAEERREYERGIHTLRELEQDIRKNREKLASLVEAKEKMERRLAARREEKRKLVARIQRDVRGRKQEESQLAREEKALRELLEAMKQEIAPGEISRHAPSIRRRKGSLSWPLPGRIIADFGSRPEGFRERLQGVRIKPRGKSHPVRAMAAGQVRYADWFGGYGLMMIVDYGDGVLGVYAHNDALYQQLGDWVEEGDVLAEAGSTGWVDEEVLYFEVRDNGKAVDPKLWCRR